MWSIALVVALTLGAANLWFGDLNQDEGWYLYAAGLVADGQLPYLDFAFTQGPVMPLIYALAHPLVTVWGVAGGRLFTVLLGLAAALLTAWFAARIAGDERARPAALLAFVLIAVNVTQSYFTTVVKTYSLSSLFIAAGFLLLTVRNARWVRGAALLAAAVFVLATGVRISAAAILPATWLYLWVQRKTRPGQWLWFALGAVIAAAALFLPFYLLARDGFLFGLFKYHTLRHVEGGFKTWCMYRAAFVSRMVQAYYPACMVLVGLGVAWWIRRRAAEPRAAPADSLAWAGWVSVIAVTLIHAAAPVPYDDYQAMIYPLAAALLALGLVTVFQDMRILRPLIVGIGILAVAASFASPINQEWFTRGRDRIWWRLKEKTALATLHEAAQKVRAVSGSCRELLTQDTYLAVAAGMRVPRGLELGPFSYYPGLDTATARKLHVVNTPLLVQTIRAGKARVAAVSGYCFSIAAPQVRPLTPAEQTVINEALQASYRHFDTVPNFGQAHTPLMLGHALR